MAALEEGTQLLARCRQGPAAWVEAVCGEAADEEGKWGDPNAARRYALLLALQYDLQPGDRDLVRFLFEQEVLRHRREPFQGLDPALPLAGYLLATFREIEHVWLLAEAKLANFDTYLGFDLQYIVSSGVAETLDHVRAASTRPLRQEVLEWLVRENGQPVISEDQLASWWKRVAAAFPAQRADENPKSRLDQALELGDFADARRWLDAWEATQSRTPRHLRTAAWYWAHLRDWDRAAAVAAEFLACGGLNIWDQASMQVQAVTYQREAGRMVKAWQQLVMARRTLERIEEWWRVGFGLSALEEALLIARAKPLGDQEAREAYTWATGQLARPDAATLHLLQLAEAAATHLGDENGRAQYHRRALRERQRIDRELGAS